mmetsp:Transcript_41272/g.94008  ORF Transcript_41272/g.94008 Transcript_41272/m.94008 type:complete len:213 (+) Transcript_41272:234-872(+)
MVVKDAPPIEVKLDNRIETPSRASTATTSSSSSRAPRARMAPRCPASTTLTAAACPCSTPRTRITSTGAGASPRRAALSWASNPKPSTLNPQPSTLNPQPSTRHAPVPRRPQRLLRGARVDVRQQGHAWNHHHRHLGRERRRQPRAGHDHEGAQGGQRAHGGRRVRAVPLHRRPGQVPRALASLHGGERRVLPELRCRGLERHHLRGGGLWV